MIGWLKGIVTRIDDDIAVIDVGGVGYEVHCHARMLAMLSIGDVAELTIETHVREDHIQLFGFLDTTERSWFRLLSSVQRVGNKAAMLMLGAMTPPQLAQAIAAKDTTAFSRLNGIGPKLAERIVAELKDKATKLPVGNLAGLSAPAAADKSGKKSSSKKKGAALPAAQEAAALEDTISALTHLGYSRTEAYQAAMQAAREVGEDATLDDIIKRSLKELSG